MLVIITFSNCYINMKYYYHALFLRPIFIRLDPSAGDLSYQYYFHPVTFWPLLSF